MDNRVESILKRAYDVKQRDPAWFLLRRKYITCSDIPIILGLSKTKTPAQIIYEKLALPDVDAIEEGDTKARDFGTKFETPALERYHAHVTDHDSNPGISIITCGLVKHKTLEWLAGSPDGIRSDGLLLEVKVPYICGFQDNYVRPSHFAQIQGLLEVCDIEECDYIQYNRMADGFEKLHVQRVKRDGNWWFQHTQILWNFWVQVQKAEKAYYEWINHMDNLAHEAFALNISCQMIDRKIQRNGYQTPLSHSIVRVAGQWEVLLHAIFDVELPEDRTVQKRNSPDGESSRCSVEVIP
jgi:putative phage-type endonuclease